MKSRVLSPDTAALLEKLEHKLGVLLRATDQAGMAADGVLWATPELPATKELQGVRKALLSMGERARDRSGCAKHAASDAMALLADLLSVLEADLSRHNRRVRQAAFEHDLVGTALCPYRFNCAAVADEVRFHSGDATEGTEISIRLARYALIDPDALPAMGDLCAFDYYGDAVIQPYPIRNDVGELLGVVASFLGVRQVRA